MWDRERGKKSRRSKLKTVEVTEFMVMGWAIGVTEFTVKTVEVTEFTVMGWAMGVTEFTVKSAEVKELMVMGWVIGVTEFMVKGWVAAGEWRSLEPRN